MGCSFRKFISVLCVLALLLGMVPSAAFAAPDGTAAGRASEPVSVAAAESGEPAADRGGRFSPKTSGGVTREVGTWSGMITAISQTNSGDTIKLTDNITAESTSNPLVFSVVENVTLDLNGHTIDRAADTSSDLGYVIRMESGSMTIKNGTIRGGKSNQYGGGIYMTGGALALSGVTVTGNSSGYGGGIRVQDGTLTLGAGSSVTGNTASDNGGGIYVESDGVLVMDGGSVTDNTASDNGGGIYAKGYGEVRFSGGSISGNKADMGGGIYVEGNSRSLVMSGGSVTGNTASLLGGGIQLNGSDFQLSGGSISGNIVENSNNVKYKDIYTEGRFSLTLSGNSAITVGSFYLPAGKTITLNGAPSAGSSVHVTVQQAPTADAPVVIAEQQTEGDYSAWLDCLVIDNRPEDTELAYEDNRIILRYRSGGVNSWAKLQTALNDGGVWDSEEQKYIIRLEDTIAAEAGDTALTFGYTGHNVVLDLCGHAIDRDLSEAAADGNVLTVNDGTLILRDSGNGGSITGGYNTAEGGGVRVLGGSFTMESGSITGNHAAENGGGVYANGIVTLEGGSITGNHAAENGGGIYNYMFSNETLYISGSVNVSDNTAGGNGGGIYLYGSGPLRMSDDVSVAGNTAGGNGGGIYMAGAFAFEMHDNSSVSGNIAEGNGGGIYMAIPTFNMHDNSSVTDNTANGKGDGIYADVSTQLHLNGGTVSHTQAGDASRVGIYLNERTLLRLDKIIHISDTPTARSSVHVRVGQSPTAAAPDVAVAEAERAEVCSAWLGCFTIDNQPEDTELVCVDEQIVLRKKSEEITTWAELQEALEDGGSWEYSESGPIHIIRLTADITAGDDDTALTFGYTGHDVILDLCGHTIDRNLTRESADGNVLTVNDGTLILRDSGNGGSITGGYNTAEGGGVRVLGGAFVMEGGSITGNTIKDVNGGGVYLNGGSFVVSGSPTVTGNTDNTGTQNPSNVYLCAGCVISLDAALTEGASFGIGAGYEGRFTDDSYEAYPVDPFFKADSMYRLYQDTDGCPCIENVNHHPAEQPVWSWADDLTAATAKLVCQNCGETIWSEETELR